MKALRMPVRNQRGFAMIALITMVTLISAYLLSSALTRTTVEVKQESDARSREALKDAKAALIAYAAAQAWQAGGANDQPGALPCPSADENGTAANSCTTESSRVGRLPWSTIGSGTIYDGSGSLVWYALSANFRKAAGSTTINSDTVGTLTVTGSSPATKIVALVIAPGAALGGQSRSSTAAASNFLESSNANTSDSDVFTTATASDTFNDQIMTITQAELMAVVEPAVAARIESSIKPYLTSYASQWGGVYPFPASFPQTTNAQSSYSGSTSQTTGLLPLTASLTYAWVSGSGSVQTSTGPANSTQGNISGVSCTAITSGTTGWRCDFTLNSKDMGTNSANWTPCTARHCMYYPAFTVSGRVHANSAGTGNANAALSFVNLPNATSEVTVTSTGGATRSMQSQAISGAHTTVSGAYRSTVSFSGTHSYTRSNNSAFTRVMRVFIPDLTVSSLTSASDTTAGWFIQQQWYRQTYYAVSSGYLPAGGASCTAGSTCLTVSGLSSAYSTSNDKRAILIFAGRSLAASPSRPSSSLSDYLEGENATPTDRTFAHFSSKTTTSGSTTSSVNDRVVVIAP